MRTLVSFIITTIMVIPAHGAQSLTAGRFTLEQFRQSHSGVLYGKSLQFLKRQARVHGRNAFYVTKVNPQHFVVSSGNKYIDIKVIDGGRQFFSINGKRFRYDRDASPEKMVAEIANLLRSKQMASRWFESLLIPKADAFWTFFLITATVAAIIVYSEYRKSQSSDGFYKAKKQQRPPLCQAVYRQLRFCRSSVLSGVQHVEKGINFLQAYNPSRDWGVCPRGRGRLELESCLMDHVQRMNPQVYASMSCKAQRDELFRNIRPIDPVCGDTTAGFFVQPPRDNGSAFGTIGRPRADY